MTKIPAETWAAYEMLKKSHTAEVTRLLMEDGLTILQIVAKLGAEQNYGWNRVTAKLNKQTDALMRGARSE